MEHTKYLKPFIKFVDSRSSEMTSGANIASCKVIYDDFIIPMLDKGVSPNALTKNDEIKFAGEIFALAMYGKKHNIHNWIYEPKTSSQLTPDFLINDSKYIEIYNPVINSPGTGLNYFLEVDRNKNFTKSTLTESITKKSSKYKRIDVTFVVCIIASDFTKDTLNALRNVKLRSDQHKIVYLHGDKEYQINQNQSLDNRSI